MDTQFYTQEAAFNKATVIQTTLATSKLRLLKAPFVPTPESVKADLVANECDFDGYTSGGYALSAWTGPGNPTDGGGGAVITSPLTSIAYGPAGSPPVTNQVSGWWIETTAGHVWLVGTYNPYQNMLTVRDIFPAVFQSIEGRTAPPA